MTDEATKFDREAAVLVASNLVCEVEDCDRPATKAGYCNAHYLRKRRHGNPHGGKHKAAWGVPRAWLRKHVGHTGAECLIWPYARGRDGRGRIARDIAPQAHRAMCILAHGPAPTPDHLAAHTCGRGHDGCVNPLHLYWATHAQNAADRWKHGTEVHGENAPGAKLTIANVQQIRAMGTSANCAELGRALGVDAETVRDALHFRTWAWLN